MLANAKNVQMLALITLIAKFVKKLELMFFAMNAQQIILKQTAKDALLVVLLKEVTNIRVLA